MPLIAVDPPKPWEVEHLYYKDTLLGKPVLVLYRFDLVCRQLYQGEYIFEHVLDKREVLQLVAAIEDKYKVKLRTQYINDDMFSGGQLNESTSVQIIKGGHRHFYTNNTVIYFHTNNFHWLGGWQAGTEPTCRGKKWHELLKEKL